MEKLTSQQLKFIIIIITCIIRENPHKNMRQATVQLLQLTYKTSKMTDLGNLAISQSTMSSGKNPPLHKTKQHYKRYIFRREEAYHVSIIELITKKFQIFFHFNFLSLPLHKTRREGQPFRLCLGLLSSIFHFYKSLYKSRLIFAKT